MYPKIEAKCNGWGENQVQSSIMPVMIRVDRMCTNYPSEYKAGCGPDDNMALTKQWENDRMVDRAMWWMFTNFEHRSHDDHSTNIHTCRYGWSSGSAGHWFKLGHALNVFIRRSHGAGPYSDKDVYYEHVVNCGIEANLSSWYADGGDLLWASRWLGSNMRWVSYGSTTLAEPVAGFGDPDYTAKTGNSALSEKQFGKSDRG